MVGSIELKEEFKKPYLEEAKLIKMRVSMKKFSPLAR
jgi:hypothetical protein